MRKLLSDGRVLAAILIFGILTAFRALMGVDAVNRAVTRAFDSVAPVSHSSAESSHQDGSPGHSSGFSSFFDSLFDDGAKDGRFSANHWLRKMMGVRGDESSGVASFGGGSTPQDESEDDFTSDSGGSGSGSGAGGASGFAFGSSSSGGGGGSGGGTTINRGPEKPGDKSTEPNPQGGGENGSLSSKGVGTTTEEENPLEAESKRVVQDFQRTAYLEFPPPEGMQFVDLDMDVGDDIATIYGVDHNTQTELAIMARRGVASPDQVKPFLLDNEIPNLPRAVVQQMGTPGRGQAPPGSGLQNPYLWQIRQGPKMYIVSLMPRLDNQGVYLGIVSGPAHQFEQGEEHFDQIFNGVKARN